MIVLSILGVVLLLAIIAIAVWLWCFGDIAGHATEIARIEVEERMALWKLDAIRRQAEAEMRRVQNTHRSRSPRDRNP